MEKLLKYQLYIKKTEFGKSPSQSLHVVRLHEIFKCIMCAINKKFEKIYETLSSKTPLSIDKNEKLNGKGKLKDFQGKKSLVLSQNIFAVLNIFSLKNIRSVPF